MGLNINKEHLFIDTHSMIKLLWLLKHADLEVS